MNVSDYDKTNLDKILAGEGDWFTAITFRYLSEVYHKADIGNKRKLWQAFSEELRVILRYDGWTDYAINTEFIAYHI